MEHVLVRVIGGVLIYYLFDSPLIFKSVSRLSSNEMRLFISLPAWI